MDISSLIGIIVVIIVAYFLIKFIISPILRIIIGVVFLVAALYFLQKLFGFNLNQLLTPLGISFDLNKWIDSFGWILSPATYYMEKIKSFFVYILGNYPKPN